MADQRGCKLTLCRLEWRGLIAFRRGRMWRTAHARWRSDTHVTCGFGRRICLAPRCINDFAMNAVEPMSSKYSFRSVLYFSQSESSELLKKSKRPSDDDDDDDDESINNNNNNNNKLLRL